jgi:hypothetical protein
MVCFIDSGVQSDMTDDERLESMGRGYERLVGLVIKHEECLTKLQLPAQERAWLRASVINPYIYLLTYLQLVQSAEAGALQVCFLSSARSCHSCNNMYWMHLRWQGYSDMCAACAQLACYDKVNGFPGSSPLVNGWHVV